MRKNSYLMVLIVLAFGCFSSKSIEVTNQEEIDLVLEVIELDLINQSSVIEEKDKTKWINQRIGYLCLSNEMKSFMEYIRTSLQNNNKNSVTHLNSDSLNVEEYIKQELSYLGLDTLWNYDIKLEYASKMFSCKEPLKVRNWDFDHKMIKCRNSNFKTWNYSNPIVLKNEYIMFSKGYVCGSLCSYSEIVIYRKVDGKWIKLPGLALIS